MARDQYRKPNAVLIFIIVIFVIAVIAAMLIMSGVIN
jgi:flagellar basal body-associated protein FliL